ncbi:PqiB family protein [Sneathiella aquimaris]|uniref:PqiB family protein n=1 Tax=Sneathiella aquimaris TaxID=2599305 RepID=UPI001469E656|nr:MlaD family protein [Sneathiella aquimaris]
MVEDMNDVEGQRPVVKKGYAGLMSIWLVPLIAIAVAGWLVVKTVSEKGPEISISLQTARGMEAGKTPLKYKDVVIGIVDRIEIPDEESDVRVIVSVQQFAEKYLTDTARFWVVAPAIGLEGISGLETLLSGAYLEIDPGDGGEEKFDFVGLDTAPVITSSTAGREFLLRTERLGNSKRGTPIIYRGIRVGKILGHKLAEDKQSVELYAFVEAPYHELVQEGSRFWDAGGVTVSLSTSGIEVGSESFETLLSGAVEFETPELFKDTWVAEEGREFALYKSRNAMEEAKYTERVSYILYFDGSVSGLEVGAAVEFKGMKIGSVRQINLEFNQDTGDYFLPVIIDIEPQRVKIAGSENKIYSVLEAEKIRGEVLQLLIERGLRARLKSANFLTGQLIVDLDMFPNKPALYRARGEEINEIPTLPMELEEITTSLTHLVEKIERLPIDRISQSFLNTAEGLERIVNSGDLDRAIKDYSKLAVSVRSMIDNIDKNTLPSIEATVGDTRVALQRVDETLGTATSLFKNADALLKDGSPLKYDLSIMLRELAAASRSVRNLADFLERNPSSLLSGKNN